MSQLCQRKQKHNKLSEHHLLNLRFTGPVLFRFCLSHQWMRYFLPFGSLHFWRKIPQNPACKTPLWCSKIHAEKGGLFYTRGFDFAENNRQRLTSIPEPLDVILNKLFKDKVHYTRKYQKARIGSYDLLGKDPGMISLLRWWRKASWKQESQMLWMAQKMMSWSRTVGKWLMEISESEPESWDIDQWLTPEEWEKNI